MKIGTDFSGIGAPEMALKYLGIDFKSVFACEIDKYARQSFEQLHNPQIFYNDITARNHKEVEQLDLYVAGFPCQSFSISGKRKGFEEARGTLFFNVAEFIKENKPKTFILENVKGLLSHDKGKTFQTIVDILSNGGGTKNGQISLDIFEDGLGYHIYWQVLNTKNYGIPQNRERIFIVGFKDFRDFNFPKEIPLELKLGDMLQDNPNSKYYLSDKVVKRIEDNLKEKDKENNTNEIRTHYLGGRKGDNKKGGTGHLCKTDDTSYCLDTANSQAIELKQIGSIAKKGSWDNPQSARIYDIKGLSPCINTMQGGGLHPKILTKITRLPDLKLKVSKRAFKTKNKIRRLTPLECWRLQGFKDEDFFSVKDISDSQLYKQAGNSITVNVLMEIFKKIYVNNK